MFTYMPYIYKELNVCRSHLTLLFGKNHYHPQVQEKEKCLEDALY